MSSNAKLQAVNLSVAYGRNVALRDVSLEMPDRAVTALLGPSGCGKSTFLRALNRMHDLTHGVRVSGQVLLDGEKIGRMDAQTLRCRVGMVFQRPNPFPMSIAENVAFGPRLFGVTGRRLDRIVAESLERAALWTEVRHRLRADARMLSGGQQQRLCIARALALSPEVLLMDEPCSALDPAATAAIDALILELKREIAVVIVTHNLAQAHHVADSAALFEAGRLVAAGHAHEVLDRFAGESGNHSRQA